MVEISEVGMYFPDYCSLTGAVNINKAARIVRNSAQVQNHRGQKGVGIVTGSGGRFRFMKNEGMVEENFPRDFDFKRLPGQIAIAHTRYATRGEEDNLTNIQPLIFSQTKFGPIALAHNGQLVDNDNLKKKLLKKGSLFQSSSDSESLLHIIMQEGWKYNTLEEAIATQIRKIPTAYSLLLMTPRKLIALRDKHGVRPLSIAKYRDGYIVASETIAFRIYEKAEFVRHVKPGEMVVFDMKDIKKGQEPKSIQFADPDEFFCSFEGIYFEDPRSQLMNAYIEDFRQKLGIEIFKENEDFFRWINDTYGDQAAIIPIMDSGIHGSEGLNKASGIKIKRYLQRMHNAPSSKGRSYILSNQREREIVARMKLDLRKEKIKLKAGLLGDDSIVRGTTTRITNQRLRDAGADYIANVIFSPKINNICYLGMDHQNIDDLIGAYQTEEEIAKELKADKVLYLSTEGLEKVFKEHFGMNPCTGCFGGKYPVLNN